MIQKAKFNPFVQNGYPTSDGRPMAETDFHRDLMFDLIDVLKHRYAADPNVYVSGDLLIFYEEGDKWRHVAPDVFVVKGVPNGQRPNYLLWKEGKGPDVVIEVTSKTTKSEDLKKKPDLYRTKLGVQEYFLFDPTEDYLSPSLQGYRRVRGEFRPVKVVGGRLQSKVLGLHLEREGQVLRLWDPAARKWLPTPAERETAVRAENERLRREIEELRRKLGGGT